MDTFSVTATFLLSVMDGTMRQPKPTLRELIVQLWSEQQQTVVCLITTSSLTTGISYLTETDSTTKMHNRKVSVNHSVEQSNMYQTFNTPTPVLKI